MEEPEMPYNLFSIQTGVQNRILDEYLLVMSFWISMNPGISYH